MAFELPNPANDSKQVPWAPLDDNFVQTFQIEAPHFRGRSVRLGAAIDDILRPHDYPPPVAHLVAETVTLAVLLSSMLKYEGIFTLQTKGDGPVGMLVADVTSAGDIRACASFDADRLAKAEEQIDALKAVEGNHNHLAQYLGKGYIAFTVDQGENTERYQGIVELKGPSLADCVHHYFSQSEQIATGIKMAVGRTGDLWRTGGLMLQHLPETESRLGNVREDEWRRAMVLMDTCKEEELLDPKLHLNELLYRLFHEDGVRVYPPLPLQNKCRCSSVKIRNVLLTMSEENIEYLSDDGEIRMNCEFCNKDYVIEKEALLQEKHAQEKAVKEKSE